MKDMYSAIRETDQPWWKFWKRFRAYRRWCDIIDLVPIYSPAAPVDILDIGCNNGLRFDLLNDLGFGRCRMYGIEIDPVKAADAMIRCREVYCGDATDILLSMEYKFDIIFMSHVLDHVKNPYEVLELACSKLRRDGELIIAVPISRGLEYTLLARRWRFYDSEHRHYNIFDPDLLCRFLKNDLQMIIDKVAFQPARQDYPVLRHLGFLGSFIANLIAWCGLSSRMVIHCTKNDYGRFL